MARQLASEKPPDPLVSGCATCGKRRTCILVNGALCCLKCVGCPWCGQRHISEDLVDDELVHDPIHLGARIIRGDWVCTSCARCLVDWSGWRRRTRNWQRGTRAMAEGYKRRRKAA